MTSESSSSPTVDDINPALPIGKEYTISPIVEGP